ncbi:MAG: hypothetical protein H7839_04610 [Magnetococcus sp. YQC-5]
MLFAILPAGLQNILKWHYEAIFQPNPHKKNLQPRKARKKRSNGWSMQFFSSLFSVVQKNESIMAAHSLSDLCLSGNSNPNRSSRERGSKTRNVIHKRSVRNTEEKPRRMRLFFLCLLLYPLWMAFDFSGMFISGNSPALDTWADEILSCPHLG